MFYLRVQIYMDLDTQNAADLLFESGWQFHDLKEDLIQFVAANFGEIKNTPGYKKVADEPENYPNSTKIMQELMEVLYFDKSRTK